MTPEPILGNGEPSSSPDPSRILERLRAFVLESCPWATPLVLGAWSTDVVAGLGAVDDLASAHLRTLEVRLEQSGELVPVAAIGEVRPRVTGPERWREVVEDLRSRIEGFWEREKIRASLTAAEKREILGGIVLTRAVDARLKTFFQGTEIQFEGRPFQGKGYRSLGQEAIWASALRLRRGKEWSGDGGWKGDVVAPLIRDLGAALAMDDSREGIAALCNAQMGKAGLPMQGRDFHVGDLSRGILPPAAPLSIAVLTATGLAFGIRQKGEDRVVLSYIGEGGSSLGEWHEAINVAAVHDLPIVFTIQNNQTALSTPVAQQTKSRVFAAKAAGYGIAGLTVDGTDPEQVAVAYAWAAEVARRGDGPVLLEVVAMRMCGHAHHDDMLYLGREPRDYWSYAPLNANGYADGEAWEYWSQKDPLETYRRRLESEGVIGSETYDRLREDAVARVEQAAQDVINASWPPASDVVQGVYRGPGNPALRRRVLRDRTAAAELPSFEPLGHLPQSGGQTFLDAVTLGIQDALQADPRVFLYGEDVGGSYGNAMLVLRPLLEEYGDRIINSPLAEGGILGVCIGAALEGLRPVGEIQFNDFVASGFNQLVNNAAKTHYRWAAAVPMVLRMPWGGLRSAGPYHSQNTEAWFYRTPGLKIVAPSTPADARALMRTAIEDPDPVLFYEHIKLYRDPSIRQQLGSGRPDAIPLGQAVLRRQGTDAVVVTYGAYVHTALAVADRIDPEQGAIAVLDLRSLAPMDRQAVVAVARACHRVLVVHEDTRTGGIGESIAAIIQEEAFEYLDAPVQIVGALDTPVPYAPSLERVFLPSEDDLANALQDLLAY